MLLVQGLVVLSEHKALRLYHLILILQGLIVVPEGFGLSVVGLFRQHQKLPHTWNSLARARVKRHWLSWGSVIRVSIRFSYYIPYRA